MARFTDLPVELQTEIWTLVLPYRGGVHWVEFAGFPRPPNVIKESLDNVHKFFGDREPTLVDTIDVRNESEEYRKYSDEQESPETRVTPFFQHLYTVVPSLWGRSGRPAPLDEVDMPAQEVLEEIAKTRCCRQLSTYTQVTTLLSTCRVSRLTAFKYLHERYFDGVWDLYRSVGPTSRPRPLSTWKEQYKTLEKAPERIEEGDGKLIPTICGTLDLVVLRLHTASGHPTSLLRNSSYQFMPYGNVYDQSIPVFNRIAIEWHSLWATPEGRKEFSDEAVGNILLLLGNIYRSQTPLYWLVDSVPRPHWDQYPPAIPTAFSRTIEQDRKSFLRPWPMEDDWKDRLRETHDLYQEFEANGRRYYVVSVITDWHRDFFIEQSLLDPALNWDGPFPGGEDLWPEALREPVRFAHEIFFQNTYEVQHNLGMSFRCAFVLSWEPI